MNFLAPIPRSQLCCIVLVLLLLSPLEATLSWQQQVAYRIDVLLDVEENMLMGNEALVYVNNSPDTLHYVWFHLYPNAYRDRDTEYAKELYKAGLSDFHFSSPEQRGYIDVLAVRYRGQPLVGTSSGTEMRLDLSRPILPADSARFDIAFLVKLPYLFDRLGRKENRYQIACWYPKIAVYDSDGWHPDGYDLIPALCGDFGIFDVNITLPYQYVVSATGELVSPPEELTRLSSLEGYSHLSSKQRDRLLHPFSQVSREATYKTLRFHADNVHDFAWTASPDYLLFTEQVDSLQIDLLLLPRDERKMREVVTYAKQAVELYQDWYGPYPYRKMTVVDGGDVDTKGILAPQLVIISNRSPAYTKFLEMEVAYQLARQWFGGALGKDPREPLRLDEAFATFSAMRYLEGKYGPHHSLIEFPIEIPHFPNIDAHYLANLYYYMYAASGYEEDLHKPARQYKEGFSTYGLASCKGALVLNMLRQHLGDEDFDTAMKAYYRRYIFRNPSLEDFVSVCEEVSGQDLDWFFEQWLNTTDRCDYEVKDFKSQKMERSPYEENPPGNYRNEIRVKRNEPIIMPLEVVSYTKSGNEYRRFWNGTETEKSITFFSWEKIERVVIDPERKILDYDRWNNYKPRRRSLQLFFDKPSFDTYQLFFIPYLFYSPSTRIQLGGILMGRQFFLAGPVRGKHQWSLAPIYSTGKKTFRHSGSYQTTLGRWGPFSKLSMGWTKSWDYINLYAGAGLERRERLLGEPTRSFGVRLNHKEVTTIEEQDPRDFSVGQYSGLTLACSLKEQCLRYGLDLETSLTLAKDLGDGVYQFGKVSAEPQFFYRWSRKVKTGLRLYGGYSWGDLPLQEHFYLSGKLIPEGLFGFTWESTGDLSPQERWHLWGDGNLRGYYGRHLKGKTIASITVEHDLPYLGAYLFLDAGNVYAGWDELDFTDTKSDLGIGFRFFIFRADLPLWVSNPDGEDNWKFRWIIGLTKGWQ